MLMRRGLMREEELGDLLGFERKQLRLIFAKLNSDLLVKTRIKVEILQNPNGTQRSNRHNYFFLNYRAFVNVVKYKLDHVRRRLETEERDSINRAFFQCNRCKYSISDKSPIWIYDRIEIRQGSYRVVINLLNSMLNIYLIIQGKHSMNSMLVISIRQTTVIFFAITVELMWLRWRPSPAARRPHRAAAARSANSPGSTSRFNFAFVCTFEILWLFSWRIIIYE